MLSSTKVQIARAARPSTNEVCVTMKDLQAAKVLILLCSSTKVQILTQKARYSMHLLYEYNSTNTDAEGEAGPKVLSFLALLVQKHTYGALSY